MAKDPNLLTARLPQQIFELIVLLIAKVVLRPFTQANVPADLYNLPAQCLIVANHRRALDPFVICSSLPLKVIVKLLPIGFITHNGFYDSPLRPLLWLMGCYPARNPDGRHRLFGIDASINLAKHGHSIFIFPEGTRVREDVVAEPRWGVIKIHQAVPALPMLLAHIEYHPGFKNWLRRRYRTVSYKLIQSPSFDDPKVIMNAIYAL